MRKFDKSQMDVVVRGSFQSYLSSFNATVGNAGGKLKSFSPETISFCEWLMAKGSGPIPLFSWLGDVEITNGEFVEVECPTFEHAQEVRARFGKLLYERYEKKIRFSHRGFINRPKDEDMRAVCTELVRYGKVQNTKETMERHLRSVENIAPITARRAEQFGIYVSEDRIDPKIREAIA